MYRYGCKDQFEQYLTTKDKIRMRKQRSGVTDESRTKVSREVST